MYEDQVVNGALTIKWCEELTSLVGLPESIESLTIYACKRLRSIAGLPEGLQSLSISFCCHLTSLEELPNGLRSLVVDECWNISALPVLPSLEALTLSRPLAIWDERIKSLDEYQEVCRAHRGGKSAYA